jgi:hypothetical protein
MRAPELVAEWTSIGMETRDSLSCPFQMARDATTFLPLRNTGSRRRRILRRARDIGKSTVGGWRKFRLPACQGHFTEGGMDDRIDSTLPPVFRPKMVPRSYSRLNST